MSGFSLLAGALSHAASDTMKGLREGEEERRKEEEAGRRIRAERVEQAFIPQRYQQGQLQNQALQQNMDMARTAEARAQALEGRNIELFPSQLQASQAQASIAGTNAQYAGQRAVKDLAALDAQIAHSQEQVRASQETTPALVDHYKRQTELLESQRTKLLQDVQKEALATEKRLEARMALSQISPSDFNGVAKVMQDYGQYFDPHDGYLNMVDNLMRIEMARQNQGHDPNILTPIQKNQIRQQNRVYSAKQADDQVRQVLGARKALEGGPDVLDTTTWFERYFRAIEEKKSQANYPGYTANPEDLVIPPIPESVKHAMVNDQRWFAAYRGTPQARQVLDLAEPFLMQGTEWNAAKLEGEKELLKKHALPAPQVPAGKSPAGQSGSAIPELPGKRDPKSVALDVITKRIYSDLDPHITYEMLKSFENGAAMQKYIQEEFAKSGGK